MMKDEESISDSVSDFSVDSDNYDQLLAAFKETHDEANRLAVICNGCTISSDSSGKVLFTGKRVNNIYLLNIMETNSSNECLLSRSDES